VLLQAYSIFKLSLKKKKKFALVAKNTESTLASGAGLKRNPIFKKDKPLKFHRSVKDFLKMIIINETEGHPIFVGHLNLDYGSSTNSYYP
jgi:hypothetical protein